MVFPLTSGIDSYLVLKFPLMHRKSNTKFPIERKEINLKIYIYDLTHRDASLVTSNKI